MFNSCNFNAVKFNSICFPEAIVAPIQPPTGGLRPRKKILKKQFFDITGTKLILSLEEFSIIGFILVADQLGIHLDAQILQQVKTDLLLKGISSYPFKTKQKILGFVKFKKENRLGIKGFGLMPTKQLHLMYGQKLLYFIQSETMKGSKSISTKQINLIKGQKDISEILELLDLFNLEE